MKNKFTNTKSFRAFTLIELLVVVGIVVVLAGLSIPAYINMSKSSALTTAAYLVIDQLNLARQTALSRNASVEVRFYKLPPAGEATNSTPTQYRGMQLFLHSGKEPEIIGKPVYLPAQIIIANSETLSSIMKDALMKEESPAADSGDSLGEFGLNYKYRSFRFKPGGSTDLPDDLVHLTLVNRNDAAVSNNPPKDFITVQIDATTGRVRSFRR